MSPGSCADPTRFRRRFSPSGDDPHQQRSAARWYHMTAVEASATDAMPGCALTRRRRGSRAVPFPGGSDQSGRGDFLTATDAFSVIPRAGSGVAVDLCAGFSAIAVYLVLQRRLCSCRMLTQPSPRVAGLGRSLAPPLVLVPGDRRGGAPALPWQHDLKQLADFRHRRRRSIFPPAQRAARSPSTDRPGSPGGTANPRRRARRRSSSS